MYAVNHVSLFLAVQSDPQGGEIMAITDKDEILLVVSENEK
ncbi:hypothetical protein [Lysinibacillus xylanilyticus]